MRALWAIASLTIIQACNGPSERAIACAADAARADELIAQVELASQEFDPIHAAVNEMLEQNITVPPDTIAKFERAAEKIERVTAEAEREGPALLARVALCEK
jgi:antirestriction protein